MANGGLFTESSCPIGRSEPTAMLPDVHSARWDHDALLVTKRRHRRKHDARHASNAR